jgi:hypothetical protein
VSSARNCLGLAPTHASPRPKPTGASAGTDNSHQPLDLAPADDSKNGTRPNGQAGREAENREIMLACEEKTSAL